MSLLDATHADRPVVEALLAGDEATFRSLVEQHYGAMIRVARRHVSSPDVAEEVVQDTWIAVINGLPRFEGRHGSSLKTWLFSILVNQARTRGVKDDRVVPVSSLLGDDGPAVDPGRFLGGGSRRLVRVRHSLRLHAAADPRSDGEAGAP